MKTTNPSHPSLNQRYRKKLQTSNSRIPFPIFDKNLKTPNHEEPENAEFGEDSPEEQIQSRVNEFSLCYSERTSNGAEGPVSRRTSQRLLEPSERLRNVGEAKAQLVEVNEFSIIVKITPSANEIHLKSSGAKVKGSGNGRKRHRKGKFGPGYKYVNSFRATRNAKGESSGEGSDHNEASVYYRQEKHNKRSNKLQYKKSKESLLDTPPILSKFGNMDKRVLKGEYYDYRGYPFDPNGTYYVVPSTRMPPHPYGFYHPDNASPMMIKMERKHHKDKYTHILPSYFKLPPVGTCPG